MQIVEISFGSISQWQQLTEILFLLSLALTAGLGILADSKFRSIALRFVASFIVYIAWIEGVRRGHFFEATFLLSFCAWTMISSLRPNGVLQRPIAFLAYLSGVALVVWYFHVLSPVAIRENIYINHPFRLYLKTTTLWFLFVVIGVVVSFRILKAHSDDPFKVNVHRIVSLLLVSGWSVSLGVTALERRTWVNPWAFDKVSEEFFLGLGPNATNQKGETRLLVAIYQRDLRKVQSLVERGADPNKQSGKTVGHKIPVALAISLGQREIAEYLLANGVEIHMKDEDGYSALLASDRDFVIMKKLIDSGADVLLRDGLGNQLIHLAAEGNVLYKTRGFDAQIVAIDLLVGSGADIDSKGYYGTPIHHAVFGANLDGVVRLLELGADPTIRNSSGKTAVEMARSLTANSSFVTGDPAVLESVRKKDEVRKQIVEVLERAINSNSVQQL